MQIDQIPGIAAIDRAMDRLSKHPRWDDVQERVRVARPTKPFASLKDGLQFFTDASEAYLTLVTNSQSAEDVCLILMLHARGAYAQAGLPIPEDTHEPGPAIREFQAQLKHLEEEFKSRLHRLANPVNLRQAWFDAHLGRLSYAAIHKLGGPTEKTIKGYLGGETTRETNSVREKLGDAAVKPTSVRRRGKSPTSTLESCQKFPSVSFPSTVSR